MSKKPGPQPLAIVALRANLHELLAQVDADFGNRKEAKEQMELANMLRQLRMALIDANDLCRSAQEIAKRDGKVTSWPLFRKKLAASLKRQHAVMYP